MSPSITYQMTLSLLPQPWIKILLYKSYSGCHACVILQWMQITDFHKKYIRRKDEMDVQKNSEPELNIWSCSCFIRFLKPTSWRGEKKAAFQTRDDPEPSSGGWPAAHEHCCLPGSSLKRSNWNRVGLQNVPLNYGEGLEFKPSWSLHKWDTTSVNQCKANKHLIYQDSGWLFCDWCFSSGCLESRLAGIINIAYWLKQLIHECMKCIHMQNCSHRFHADIKPSFTVPPYSKYLIIPVRSEDGTCYSSVFTLSWNLPWKRCLSFTATSSRHLLRSIKVGFSLFFPPCQAVNSRLAGLFFRFLHFSEK